MHTVLVQITVDELDHFLHVFQIRGKPLRERYGRQAERVMAFSDDPERVALLFDWDHGAFAGFLADPEVQASMKAGGTLGPPQITYLTELGVATGAQA